MSKMQVIKEAQQRLCTELKQRALVFASEYGVAVAARELAHVA